MTESKNARYRGPESPRAQAPLMCMSRVESEVLGVLFDTNRPMTVDEIDAVRAKVGAARNVLLDLKSHGWLTICKTSVGDGKRLTSYLYTLTDQGKTIIKLTRSMKFGVQGARP